MGKDNPLRFEDRTFSLSAHFDDINKTRGARQHRIEYSHLVPTFKGTFVDASKLRIIHPHLLCQPGGAYGKRLILHAWELALLG
eukprot:8462693-Prorocentrum_lima.AAC.1